MFLSAVPDNLHLRISKELSEETSGPPVLFSNKSWNIRETQGGWESANVEPVFKNGRRNDAEKRRLVGPTSVSSKRMEKPIQI